MAVKIRLARRGRKKLAMYDIVIADERAPRDGRFIEKIGVYNPNVNPAHIDVKEERAFHWVMVGAQPTDTVKAILSYRGLLYKKHLQHGVIKGAVTQEDADKRLEEWMSAKEGKITAKREGLSQAAEADRKSRMEAETKVRTAREEALREREAAAKAEADAVEAAKTAATETVAKAKSGEEAPEEEAAAPEAEAPKEEGK